MFSMQGKTGIAVIGLGRIGESHLDGIRQNSDKAFIAAVVDVDESRARSTAERHNTKYYLSVEDALKDPAIQAAVICLPHYLHQPVALQIMESGRHVLVEKPWTVNLVEVAYGLIPCRGHMIWIRLEFENNPKTLGDGPITHLLCEID